MTNILTPERNFLRRTGLTNEAVFAGIQPDDCVVWRRLPVGGFQNFSLCDHSCVVQVKGKLTGGSYDCGASFVYAKGSSSMFAPKEAIIAWTNNVAAGLALARDMFLDRYFNPYCEEFHISPSWAGAIRAELSDPKKTVEANRFGGSPERVEGCPEIVAAGKKAGFLVNLTTPGRRWMIDREFAEKMATPECSPNILAMSFDDMSPEDLYRITRMDLDAIKAEWKTVSPLHGQRQKAYEAIYTARLMRQMNAPAKMLFNVVAHAGNIQYLNDVLATILECVPQSLANPYPAQAFGNAPPCWKPESLPALRAHILNFIEGTLVGRPGVTRRLAYYMMLEAAFRKWEKTDPNRLCEFMSGIRAWDSTLRPGAYRYAQIGKSIDVLDLLPDQLPLPGGHLGCFWNPGWAFSEQVGDNVERLAETMLTGMVARGQEFPEMNKSNIMPRLELDQVGTEQGMPPELVPTYLATRLEFAGF